MTDRKPNDREEGLDAAKKKLSEITGRPFDVDKILAQNRAQEERARAVAQKAAEKLERERAFARQRRHELQLRELESENRELSEKERRPEETKRRALSSKFKLPKAWDGEDTRDKDTNR